MKCKQSKPLECCIALADESDMCEMFAPKKIPNSCKECNESYLISKPPLYQKYCNIVNDDVSHKTRKRHPRCPYNQMESEATNEHSD